MTISSQVGSTWDLLKQAYAEWSEDNASRLAAALAFYAMLSLAPLLIICIAVLGFIFGEQAIRQQVAQSMGSLMGQQGAQVAQQVGQQPAAQGAGGGTVAGIVATVVSALVLLYSASNVFSQLQESLNTIWDVRPKPNRPLWRTVWSRGLAFAMVIGAGVLMLLLVAANTVTSALTARFQGAGAIGAALGTLASLLVTIALATLLFAVIYKYVPDVKVTWRSVWVGALVTAVLFGIGNYLLGWYLGRGSATSVYGAAGSIVAVLLWVYYTSQILFFGAEFTQVYAPRRGGEPIVPADDAEWIPGEEPEHKTHVQGAPPRQPKAAFAPQPSPSQPSRRWPEAPSSPPPQPAASLPPDGGTGGKSRRPALMLLAGFAIAQVLNRRRAEPQVVVTPAARRLRRTWAARAHDQAKAALKPRQRQMIEDLERQRDELAVCVGRRA